MRPYFGWSRRSGFFAGVSFHPHGSAAITVAIVIACILIAMFFR